MWCCKKWFSSTGYLPATLHLLQIITINRESKHLHSFFFFFFLAYNDDLGTSAHKYCAVISWASWVKFGFTLSIHGTGSWWKVFTCGLASSRAVKQRRPRMSGCHFGYTLSRWRATLEGWHLILVNPPHAYWQKGETGLYQQQRGKALSLLLYKR